MKQKINYGFFNQGALIISIVLWIVFITLFILYWALQNKEVDKIFFWTMVGIFFIMATLALFSVPFYVSVDDENLNVHKFLRTKKFKMNDIKSVKPTEVSRRDLKKYRGFLNQKKYYTGGDGEYYFYYGSPKNPVLITFKDGSRMVIGSTDQKEFIDAINNRLTPSKDA